MTYPGPVILFPIEVLNPDGTSLHSRAKVVASEGTTRVYVWDFRSNTAQQVMEVQGEPVQAGATCWTIATGEGTIPLRKSAGCGCGHPLKRWHPPAPVVA